jgi:translation initiation factor IF-2
MNALQIRNTESVSIQIVPAAFTMRQDVLDDSATIITVTTPVTQKAAVEAARAIASLLKAVETSRKEAKAPVLDLGQRIDATAKEFIKDVLAEEARLKRLLTDYEIEQRRLAMEAERKRQEEERKLRAAEEARLAEIRRREEAARRDAMMAETEAQRIAAERAMACAEFDRAAAAAARPIVAPAPIQPVKAAGTIVRDEWNFEVTDLAAFAAAHPELVEITVKRAAVLQKIRAGCRQLAHTRIFEETKVGVRP